MNVLIDVPVYAPALERLRAVSGVRVELIQPPAEEARVLPTQLIADKQILLCTSPPVNLQEMKALRLIQISSAGYAQLTELNLPQKGIRACNALGVFDVPIAEWNIAMMVNLARDLRGMIRNQERGIWDRSAIYQKEIRGTVVGLWGYGGIGRETARLAKAMGQKVHVLCRSSIQSRSNNYRIGDTGDPEGLLPDKVFRMDQKEEFLRGLDFLILAMPLTASNNGIIGEAELRALPRHAFILNPARGPLIQEAALLRALREGWIAGAALDTHYHYPMPVDHPLWQFSNVIMTPHISGSSLNPQFTQRVWDLFVSNVERFILNKTLLNELSPAQLNGQ